MKILKTIFNNLQLKEQTSLDTMIECLKII